MESDRLDRLGYVVVEGPIGAGKTTLAQRLAEVFNCETLLEAPEDNPFLERFYTEGCSMALPTQLYFLFQRSKQFKALKQGDLFQPRIVSDFMVQKDPLFARLNLDEDELALYEQVYENMTLEAPVPDLVIYLQAPVDVLLERIRKRDRPEERTIEPDYLQRLCEAYTDFFYYYDEAPLLIVNSTGINLAENDDDFQLLLDRIANTGFGKHYFNPTPLSLK